jgi:hypothetical protein
MTEVFLPYENHVFGCDSEGMFVRNEVVDWLVTHSLDPNDTPFVRMQRGGAMFEFANSNEALMFKLVWGGQ